MSKVIFKVNGKEVTAEELDEVMAAKDDWLSAPPMVTDTYSEHDPLISEGCGVMRSQVEETRAAIKKHNIKGTSVMPNGQVRFTSRRGRKEFLKMRGLVDFDGMYGDG
jgi:hypothetical protein